jgi:hypothetical protein
MATIIVGIRLSSNEDIIAQVDGALIDKYNASVCTKLNIKVPALIGMMPGKDGNPTMGLADFMPFAEKKEMILSERHIIYLYELDKNLEAAYKRMFNVPQGLVLPEKPSLVIPFTNK